MDILLTGTEEWAMDDVRRRLTARGHRVHACFDEMRADIRCNATDEHRSCPATLDVDVILAVRAHPLPHVTRREQIVDCPMLSRIPLVVAGSTVLNPFGARAEILIEGYDDIEAACRDASASRHSLA